MNELVGKTFGHYHLIRLVGEGGFGAVFQARDESLMRFVAVKVLHPHFANQPNLQERFLREARAAAAMDHPGIVKVYDFGQTDDLLYIVMEYIPGSNLRELLTGLRETKRQMPLPVAEELGRQVCLAVDYAHRQGVLHRDIKPDNIMLKLGGVGVSTYQPVLTDLGLARLLDEQSITQAGESMGTPAYMSPEQAMGESTDARSDVYALGVLLFELVTGKVPFPAKTITEAIRYHTREPVPLPTSINQDIPPSLETVILKALEKDPSDRFPDAGSLAQALERSLVSQVDIPPITVADEIRADTEVEVPITVIPATQIDQSPERTEIILPTSEYIETEKIEEPEVLHPVEATLGLRKLASSLFECSLSPEETRSGKPVRISVHNRSDTSQTFEVNFQDPTDVLLFDPPEIKLDISPNQQADKEFRIEGIDTYLFGSKKLCQFSTVIQSSSGETQILNGRVIRRALIPIWLPFVALFVVLAAWFMFPPKPVVPPAESPIVVVPPTESPTVFVTPTIDPWIILDDDGDGLTNGQELEYGLDPQQPLGGGTGWLAFQQESDDGSFVFKTTIGGTNLTQLTSDKKARYPRWSPDGRKIAFLTGTPDPENPEPIWQKVHVMDPDGSNIELASDRPSNNSRPDWSPDNRRIIDAGLGGLYTVSIDGEDPEMIESKIDVSDPVWSPDGQWVAFFSWVDDKNRDIYKMAIDGSTLTRLTTVPGQNRDPDWSPDGQQIAFAYGTEWGLMDIYTMNADGSNLKRLTQNSRNDWGPTWSPDGEWIAFTGDGEIYVVKIDGSLEMKVTNRTAEDYHEYPTWQPSPSMNTPSPMTPSSTLTPTIATTSTPTISPSTPAIGEGSSLVLWDLSHGPRQSGEIDKLYEPDGLYSDLKSLLEENNILLVANRDHLEQVDLSKYAMIVIAMTSAQEQFYTTAEAQIIGEFVKRGGSLLILAENPDFPNRIREVTGYYDIDIGLETISKSVTGFEDHPIFRNVDVVYFEFEGGSINVRNKQARVIASKNGKAAIVVIEDLPGRVVVVGDSNLFDNRGLWRNKQFAINLFRWLM